MDFVMVCDSFEIADEMISDLSTFNEENGDRASCAMEEKPVPKSLIGSLNHLTRNWVNRSSGTTGSIIAHVSVSSRMIREGTKEWLRHSFSSDSTELKSPRLTPETGKSEIAPYGYSETKPKISLET